jgi:hypothetical protein
VDLLRDIAPTIDQRFGAAASIAIDQVNLGPPRISAGQARFRYSQEINTIDKVEAYVWQSKTG